MTAKQINDEQRDHIRKLHDENGSHLEARAFVDDAASEDSPLHDLLEWNDAIAGDQYRISQAREIIRSVSYTYVRHTTIVTAPVYMRDPDVSSGYTTVASLATDEDRARAALINEFVAVRGRLERARKLARALELEHEIDKLLHGIADVQQRFAESPSMQQ